MNRNWLAIIAIGLAIAVGITFFSPWASSHPDGLEKVAEDKGFLDDAKDAPYEIIPDYTFPGVDNEKVATVLAGVVGVFIVAGIAFAAGTALKASARSRSGGDGDGGGSMRSSRG
jgi:hypothetical protein